mmetsp:Transcript_2682/g.8346  ORF Transcript_2682/g.8346 Transcript_2682/m.8346 type:complete len:401 (-) Transcript_2682:454-1656(-)
MRLSSVILVDGACARSLWMHSFSMRADSSAWRSSSAHELTSLRPRKNLARPRLSSAAPMLTPVAMSMTVAIARTSFASPSMTRAYSTRTLTDWPMHVVRRNSRASHVYSSCDTRDSGGRCPPRISPSRTETLLARTPASDTLVYSLVAELRTTIVSPLMIWTTVPSKAARPLYSTAGFAACSFWAATPSAVVGLAGPDETTTTPDEPPAVAAPSSSSPLPPQMPLPSTLACFSAALSASAASVRSTVAWFTRARPRLMSSSWKVPLGDVTVTRKLPLPSRPSKRTVTMRCSSSRSVCCLAAWPNGSGAPKRSVVVLACAPVRHAWIAWNSSSSSGLATCRRRPVPEATRSTRTFIERWWRASANPSWSSGGCGSSRRTRSSASGAWTPSLLPLAMVWAAR